jgi:hypothetical protein
MSVLTRQKRQARRFVNVAENLRGAGAPFERVFGLRLNFDRLGESDERERFVVLAAKATTEAEGVNLDALSKRERRDLERLLGQAAGEEDVFDRRRQEAKETRELRDLARRALRPPARPVVKVAGGILFEREALATMFGASGAPSMPLEDVAFGLWLLAAFANPDLELGPTGSRQDADGSITFERQLLLRYGQDVDGRLSPTKALARLERYGLIETSRRGSTITVRPGKFGRSILAAGTVRS